jgi:hypothetical protein
MAKIVEILVREISRLEAVEKQNEVLQRQVLRLEHIERNYFTICEKIRSPVISTGDSYHDVAKHLNETIKLLNDLAPKY